MPHVTAIILAGIISAKVAAATQEDPKLRALISTIYAEVAEFCDYPSEISAQAGAFTLEEDGSVTVHLGKVQCRWTYSTNPFCGAQYCTVRVYRPSNRRYQLESERLE